MLSFHSLTDLDLGYKSRLVELMGLEKELEVTKKLESSGAFEVTIKSKEVADKIRDKVDALTKKALGHDVSSNEIS